MTHEEEPARGPNEESVPEPDSLQPAAAERKLIRVPALVAIALYMFLLAGMNVVSVAKGLARPSYLIFSAAFFTAPLRCWRRARTSM